MRSLPTNTRAPDTPKTWGEMTDAEKGALLLAAHEGKVIELRRGDGNWDLMHGSQFHDFIAYRIKPAPKRETVSITGFSDGDGDWIFAVGAFDDCDTHRLTFDLIGGEPDTDSIRMEKLS